MDDMMPVTIYVDTITEYPREYIDSIDDNLISVGVSRDVLLQYYMILMNKNSPEGFDDWYDNKYDADDVDSLYDYAKSVGRPLDVPKLEPFIVEVTSTHEVWAESDANAVRQAMARTNADGFSIYVDGKLWS